MNMISLKNFAVTALVAVASLVANATHTYKQYPIAFQVWSGPVPEIGSADPNFYEADAALRAKYGAENGFIATAVGTRGQLMILTESQRSMRQIWRKMQESGDVTTRGNVTYFRYLDPNSIPSPVSNFQYVGKLHISEGARGTFWLANGTPHIVAYRVAMEEKCGLSRSGVLKVWEHEAIIPTRLVRSERIGSYTISYEHSVNGGQGALLKGITVDMARHGGPFIVDICPVDLYVQYAR